MAEKTSGVPDATEEPEGTQNTTKSAPHDYESFVDKGSQFIIEPGVWSSVRPDEEDSY
ncbi:hypothetical protein ACFWM1_17160 [Nocardia sp. NPDC058379]|uniref:hypothetical protein n=1 Tax=unclassified Nocardia TaxID=2637762 RepID=UPI00364D2061